jgi:hypothetical protein
MGMNTDGGILIAHIAVIAVICRDRTDRRDRKSKTQDVTAENGRER